MLNPHFRPTNLKLAGRGGADLLPKRWEVRGLGWLELSGSRLPRGAPWRGPVVPVTWEAEFGDRSCPRYPDNIVKPSLKEKKRKKVGRINVGEKVIIWL